MAKQLTSMDMYFLNNEFQILLDAKVDKIFQIGKEEFYFSFHKTGLGKKLLYVSFPGIICMTDRKLSSDKAPPNFCMMLRKKLSNSRLRKMMQIGSERILKLVFETKEEKFILILELFSRGNLVLCDAEGSIIQALLNKRWKDRIIRGGIKYELPPQRFDIFSDDENGFSLQLKDSKRDSVVKALAIDLGLGGTYAEEICARAGIAKDVPIDGIADVQIRKIFKGLSSLLNQKIDAKLVLEKGEAKDMVPFPFRIYEGFEMKDFDSFNSVIDKNLSGLKAQARSEAALIEKNREVEGLKKAIAEQEDALRVFEKAIVDNEKKGQMLYEHYAAVDDILKEIRKAIKKFSQEDIRERLKGHKMIKEINFKDKKITIDL